MSTARILFILICIATISYSVYLTGRIPSRAGTSSLSNRNYHATLICDDAWQHDVYPDANADHFDITLQEGCFSGIVSLPARFIANIGQTNTYHWQPFDPDPNCWAAMWFQGSSGGVGPYGPNDTPDHRNTPAKFRLQGHGRIRYYTNNPPLAFPERNQTPR